ncbi:MAG: hypothetical protein IH994_07760, partial [Proteobacteria bacterium]|nr:hypothetical protein [Pseudomonadota bacterium]
MTDSWWLKFKRAQEHMEDIQGYARSYADSHPYEAVRIKYGKRQEGIWRYRLSFTEDPDPWIAIILGDFVHNLRSALDHVVVGSVSKRYQSSAGFPIEERDPWRKKGRRFVERDPEARKRFLRRIKGLSSEAQAFVKTCQPYQRPDRSHENILFILSSLENLDKHRKLIPTASGLINPTRTITINGQTVGTDGLDVTYSANGLSLSFSLTTALNTGGGTSTFTVQAAGCAPMVRAWEAG